MLRGCSSSDSWQQLLLPAPAPLHHGEEVPHRDAYLLPHRLVVDIGHRQRAIQIEHNARVDELGGWGGGQRRRIAGRRRGDSWRHCAGGLGGLHPGPAPVRGSLCDAMEGRVVARRVVKRSFQCRGRCCKARSAGVGAGGSQPLQCLSARL
jgi:hypothetical protein